MSASQDNASATPATGSSAGPTTIIPQHTATTRYEILQNLAGNPGFFKGQICTLPANDARNLLAAGLARVHKTPEDIAEELLELRRPDIERAAIVSHLAKLGLDFDGNKLPPREDAEGRADGGGEGGGEGGEGGKKGKDKKGK